MLGTNDARPAGGDAAVGGRWAGEGMLRPRGAAFSAPLARAIGPKWVFVPLRGLRVGEQLEGYAARGSGPGSGD